MHLTRLITGHEFIVHRQSVRIFNFVYFGAHHLWITNLISCVNSIVSLLSAANGRLVQYLDTEVGVLLQNAWLLVNWIIIRDI